MAYIKGKSLYIIFRTQEGIIFFDRLVWFTKMGNPVKRTGIFFFL